MGENMKDVRQILWIFDPLPPCPHYVMICSTKSTQSPLLDLLLGYPLPHPVRTSFMNGPVFEPTNGAKGAASLPRSGGFKATHKIRERRGDQMAQLDFSPKITSC